MICEIVNGLKIGLKDASGIDLCIGDRVKSKNGYEGIISFGIYDGFHYGVYIKWELSGRIDKTALRRDVLYWSDKIHIVNCQPVENNF